MSMFSNDVRVATTATPSFQSQVNVGGFGWTNADQGHYNQLLQYVDECRQIRDAVEVSRGILDQVISESENITNAIDFIYRKSEEIQNTALTIEQYADQVNKIYPEITILHNNVVDVYAEFMGKYSEFVGLEGRVTALELQTRNSASTARSEATRAKEAADKAIQISGLSTVEDAVALTGVPIADVWAPLTDNLNLITGKGIDIKVGDDVLATKLDFTRASTATYIDKSGILKTAAINEPRFEQEGLLIEIQSTNMIPNSQAISPSQFGDAWVNSEVGEGWFKVSAKTLSGSSEPGYCDISNGASMQKGIHTFSVDVKATPDFSVRFARYGSDSSTSSTFTITEANWLTVAIPTGWTMTRYSDWFRITLTCDFVSEGTRIFRIYPNASSNFTSRRDFVFRRLQIEALNYSTSYIPTTGVAASRVRDVCKLQWEGNMLPLMTGNPFTISAEYHLWNGYGNNHRCLLQHDTSYGNMIFRLNNTTSDIYFYRSAGGAGAFSTNGLINKPFVATISCSESDYVSLYLDGTRVGYRQSAPTAPGMPTQLGLGSAPSGSYSLSGHIKNLRIWNRAFSDIQLRGIK